MSGKHKIRYMCFNTTEQIIVKLKRGKHDSIQMLQNTYQFTSKYLLLTLTLNNINVIYQWCMQ